MDLTKVPEVDLQKEIARRRELERMEIANKRAAHVQLILQNIDVLLAFVPEHSRTSCSDKDPTNEGRCQRCAFLEIKASSYVGDRRVSIEVSY